MNFRVVVCGCLDAGILVSARTTNTGTMRAEVELYSTLHPTGTRASPPVLPHWSHLLIDEVSSSCRDGSVLITSTGRTSFRAGGLDTSVGRAPPPLT